MKKLLIASALALAATTGAYAQASGGGEPGGAQSITGSVQTPSADQQRMIRGYWQRERISATTLPDGVVVSRGEVVPMGVTLQTFPNDVGMTQYRYIVVGNSMYLVNPADRRVVHVLQ